MSPVTPVAPITTIPLWRNGGPYISRDREALPGGMLALSLAPRLLIAGDARSTSFSSVMPVARKYLLRRAVQLFSTGEVGVPGMGKQDFSAFCELLWTYCGFPSALTERWAMKLSEIVERLPEGGVGGTAMVSLPANTFLCLEACFTALMGADRVWIRPSRREPFSALRLLGALIDVGWPADRLGFYPCDRAGLATLIEASDCATIFGGEGIMATGGTKVDIRGPGRAAVHVAGGLDAEWAADLLLPLIAGDGGRFCTAPGTIVVDGDPLPLGHALAKRLDRVRLGDPVDIELPQVVDRPGTAALQWRWLEERIGPCDRLLTARRGMIATPAGLVPAPSIVALSAPSGSHPLIGIELSFPAAIVVEGDLTEFARLSPRAQFRFRIGEDRELKPMEGERG